MPAISDDFKKNVYTICDQLLVRFQDGEDRMRNSGYEFRDPFKTAHDGNLVPSAAAYMLKMYDLMCCIDLDGIIHTWAAAFFYLSMLIELRQVSVNPRNFGTMMTGALMLAIKFEYDIPYDNKSFAKLTTNRLPTAVINSIEDIFMMACGLTEGMFSFPVICGQDPLYLAYASDIKTLFN